jgi:hypothetical protein
MKQFNTSKEGELSGELSEEVGELRSVIPMSATQLISEQELFEQFKDWKNFGFPNGARMLYQLELAMRKIVDMTARLKRVHEAARLIQQHNDGAALDVIIMLSEGGYGDVQ